MVCVRSNDGDFDSLYSISLWQAMLAFTGMVVAMVKHIFLNLIWLYLDSIIVGYWCIFGARLMACPSFGLLKVPSIVINFGPMSIYRGLQPFYYRMALG